METALREKVPGQVLAAVKQDLVILGVEAHTAHTGLVVPVTEIQNHIFDVRPQAGGQQWAAGKPVQNPQQPGHGEIGAVVASVD
jgi:hypothetical protein